MVTFETEEPTAKAPTFGDVAQNQLFVNEGFLCQKVSDGRYNCIADPHGYPNARQIRVANPQFARIQRILPKVTKINF